MFIDTTSKLQTSSYEYSLIQYSNVLTGELFNIGLVMNYNDGHFIQLNTIKPKILNCIGISDLPAMNYSVSLIHERLEDGEIRAGKVSNVINVSQPNIYTSSENEQDVFNHLINEFISLKAFRTVEDASKTIKYGKMQVIKSLRSLNKNKNIMFHSHIDALGSIVDAAYIKDDKPIVIANITSLHTRNFFEHIATAAFELEGTKKIETIKDKFIYAPKLTSLTKNDDKKLDQAIETAREMGVDIIIKNNHQEMLERLSG